MRKLAVGLGDVITRQGMMGRLKLLESAQWWEPERLETERDRVLSDLMAIVSEVPYYRSQFEKEKLKPTDIRTSGDLHKLPINTKDDLRAGYPELTTRDTGRKTYEACSSGSTGKPFCVREDAETAGWYRASFLLAAGWSGWNIGDRHLQMGMTLARRQGRWLKDLLLRTTYVSAYDLTEATLDSHLAALDRHRIQHVWGYPVAVYLLARRGEQMGWNTRLRGIVTWGDTLHPAHRKVIERVFQTPVYDTYGCGEGFQVAAQCGEGTHYHVHDLDVVIEYLGADDQPVDPGQQGSIVVTRLHPGPTPLIRYRVGDLAIRGRPLPCPCDRGFSILEAIQGREADVITTPSGNRLIVHFFTGVLEHFPQLDEFQVVQDGPDHLWLRVVPAEGFSEEVGRKAVNALKERGAQDLDIELDVVDEIPVTSGGKRRFVLRQIENQVT